MMQGVNGRLFPAVPVPFDENGEIHREAQRAYAEWMSRRDVGGVVVWAHTGRGLRLSVDQRREVLSSWRAAMPSDRHVWAAAGSAPDERRPDAVLDAARSMARQAAELGASALLAHPPTSFRGRPDCDRLVLEYHAAVAEAGLPLVLFYLYEAAGGISYPPHVLGQLLARPEVLGIKIATLDSVMRFQEIARLVKTYHPDKIILTGEDRFLGYSLMAGASAALIGMGAACVDLQARFLDCRVRGDASRFLEFNAAIDDLAMHTFVSPMEGYILRMLWCLVHQGVIPAEAAHDPWGPRLGAGEFDEIKACLKRIGEL